MFDCNTQQNEEGKNNSHGKSHFVISISFSHVGPRICSMWSNFLVSFSYSFKPINFILALSVHSTIKTDSYQRVDDIS